MDQCIPACPFWDFPFFSDSSFSFISRPFKIKGPARTFPKGSQSGLPENGKPPRKSNPPPGIPSPNRATKLVGKLLCGVDAPQMVGRTSQLSAITADFRGDFYDGLLGQEGRILRRISWRIFCLVECPQMWSGPKYAGRPSPPPPLAPWDRQGGWGEEGRRRREGRAWLEGRPPIAMGDGGDAPNTSWGQTHIWGLTILLSLGKRRIFVTDFGTL